MPFHYSQIKQNTLCVTHIFIMMTDERTSNVHISTSVSLLVIHDYVTGSTLHDLEYRSRVYVCVGVWVCVYTV